MVPKSEHHAKSTVGERDLETERMRLNCIYENIWARTSVRNTAAGRFKRLVKIISFIKTKVRI